MTKKAWKVLGFLGAGFVVAAYVVWQLLAPAPDVGQVRLKWVDTGWTLDAKRGEVIEIVMQADRKPAGGMKAFVPLMPQICGVHAPAAIAVVKERLGKRDPDVIEIQVRAGVRQFGVYARSWFRFDGKACWPVK